MCYIRQYGRSWCLAFGRMPCMLFCAVALAWIVRNSDFPSPACPTLIGAIGSKDSQALDIPHLAYGSYLLGADEQS